MKINFGSQFQKFQSAVDGSYVLKLSIMVAEHEEEASCQYSSVSGLQSVWQELRAG